MHHQQFDMHLSAEHISREVVAILEKSGFTQDYFRNNRNSEPPHYHASYRMHLNKPENALWESTVALLTGDPNFRGCLEEEMFSDTLRYEFDTHAVVCPSPLSFKPFVLSMCAVGEHKACDIHINIDLERTHQMALAEMERFNFISFEREVRGNMRRIYSLTFEDLEFGDRVFRKLYGILKCIPSLVGKMKLEKVTRFLVYPNDANQLPIVRNQDAQKWLAG